MSQHKLSSKARGAALIGWAWLTLLLGGCGKAATPPAATPTEPRPPGATVVSLTFDDGDADNFAAAEVLKQNGLHGTFYIPSGRVGQPGTMTWDQLHTLQNDGNEIGGHSLDHVNIGNLEGASLQREVCDDRQNLTAHGFNAVSFAYPFGGYVEATKQVLRECGYSDGRTIGAGPEDIPPGDPYALRALPYVVDDTDFTKLQRYVAGTRQAGGGWVILIFHHVCNGCDYFSVKPDIFSRFVRWLVEQEGQGHLTVKTVREVMLGNVSP